MIKSLIKNENKAVIGFDDTLFTYNFEDYGYLSILLAVKNEYKRRRLPIARNMAAFYKITGWGRFSFGHALNHYKAQSDQEMIKYLICVQRILGY